MITDTSEVPRMIAQAVENEIHRVIDSEIEQAKMRIEKEIRGRVGAIAAKVLERFSYDRVRNELLIRVDFGNQ